VTNLGQKYAFREAITSGFRDHLLGPGSPDEILEVSPLDVYSIGMLHPLEQVSNEIQVDAIGIGGAESEEDEDYASLANNRYPSSLGVTFALDSDFGNELIIVIRAAKYEYSGGDWIRQPISEPITTISSTATDNFKLHPIRPGLDLRYRVRLPDENGYIAVTLVLMNSNPEILDRKMKAEGVFFQPEISVEIDALSKANFVDRSQVSNNLDDNEVKLSRLLFRHTKNLATGHGCAVEWDDSDAPKRLLTTYLPTYDLKLAESNPSISSWALDMRAPSQKPKSDLITEFYRLVEGYESWISSQVEAVSSLPMDLIGIAQSNIDDCKRSAARMRAGIQMLEDPTDLNPYKAFVYMSEAMVEQRLRSEIVLAQRKDIAPDLIPAIWRPFQIMFILQCLGGIVDDGSPDREIADLLWFPTGGGKTEAYLGLIGFTLILRRLENRPHGVSTIMRYTLRLLTTQQFERAALLMCCCEKIRRTNIELGVDPFEVGLFVGRSGTPNNLKDAAKALAELRINDKAEVSKFGNPIQINKCVWCGEELGPLDYSVTDRCSAKCPDSECLFSSGLPWLVVDEDIYLHRPNLIIGTVDKFAMLAIKDDAGRLFNRDLGLEPGIDLIIQDELHLISGPLGTLTGLYEAAIDEIGRRNLNGELATGPRPKIIASSATIRRSAEQVRSVFDREVSQFPPSALDSRDSYFAVESSPERKGTRRYVGVMAPGLSQATLLIRTYASVFHQTTLGDWSPDVRDVYWTLVAYFNSLRILASAQLLMQDDVGDRLQFLNGGTPHSRRPDENRIELTSRSSATDIPKFLTELRIGLPDKATVETLLATNMISVGVDIDRLGVMVIAGQPQGTAEYIQASSRVGRRDPGLVFAVYNSARSRDRSHFETFLPYHSALYRRVEATSVTPFSPRARERALHAAFVILCRYLIPGLRKNEDAMKVNLYTNELKAIRDLLLVRVSRVDPLELNDTKAELDDFINHWKALASNSSTLHYQKFKEKQNVLLYDLSETDDKLTEALPILMSMRDVDSTSSLYEVNGRAKHVAR
jgi:hypothetical protein